MNVLATLVGIGFSYNSWVYLDQALEFKNDFIYLYLTSSEKSYYS